VKARKVKGLDPDAPFEEAARRIARVREKELRSFWPAVEDPARVEELHDMRIAAKRLRYVLELSASVDGDRAGEGARRARALQDLLGEIHDCDVMLPLVAGHEALSERFRHRRAELHAQFLDMWRTMNP
jgi:CHAD domain-containing protein